MRTRFLLTRIIWSLLLGLLWPSLGMALALPNFSPAPSERDVSSLKADFPGHGGDSWLARDKRLHMAVSAGMVGLGFHLLHDRWHLEVRDSRNLTVSLTALAGIIKEMTDKRKTPPTCSYKDLVADGLGILVGMLAFSR